MAQPILRFAVATCARAQDAVADFYRNKTVIIFVGLPTVVLAIERGEAEAYATVPLYNGTVPDLSGTTTAMRFDMAKPKQKIIFIS